MTNAFVPAMRGARLVSALALARRGQTVRDYLASHGVNPPRGDGAQQQLLIGPIRGKGDSRRLWAPVVFCTRATNSSACSSRSFIGRGAGKGQPVVFDLNALSPPWSYPPTLPRSMRTHCCLQVHGQFAGSER